MTPAVSVVIPARDAAATLGATLDALAAQRGAPPFEVLVVDDGSRDATAALAERHPLGPRVLRRAGGGAGLARAEGFRAATGRVIAFTDADCRPAPDWLAAGCAAVAAGAGLVQGRVVPDPAARRTRYDRTLTVERETGLYEMANLFAAREAAERAGGPGPGIYVAPRESGEDTLFGWRVRRAGARTAFCPEAVVHHAVVPGTARDLLRDRTRLRLFPALTAEIPELRDHVLHRRLFLSPRSAAFDFAAAGAIAAVALRRPLLLAAAAPYARRAWREAGGDPRHAAVLAAADAVGLAALLRGSVASRAPVL